jgi:hypothetical protein
MISHRLADDYVMVDLFSFSYDLLQSICSVCKSFLLTSFMNENNVFSFRENFTYPPKVSRFLQIPPMFKSFHLSVSNFVFLSLCPFRIEIFLQFQFYP